MGVIYISMVVTCTDQCGRDKAVQPGNQEQATAIICINGESQSIPLFMAIQGKYYLASWYTKGGLPHDQGH